MKQKQDKLPYGHPLTIRDMPKGYPCKGFARAWEYSDMALSKQQELWVRLTARKSHAWM